VNYYNEFDPYAAAWLRNLIAAGHLPAGDVDERSIADVSPADLAGYTQCHFFAGIGGWSRALALAHGARSRVGRLRAYGNAIVPQVAAEFIQAYMERIT
jgi:hypothetical protein